MIINQLLVVGLFRY